MHAMFIWIHLLGKLGQLLQLLNLFIFIPWPVFKTSIMLWRIESYLTKQVINLRTRAKAWFNFFDQFQNIFEFCKDHSNCQKIYLDESFANAIALKTLKVRPIFIFFLIKIILIYAFNFEVCLIKSNRK